MPDFDNAVSFVSVCTEPMVDGSSSVLNPTGDATVSEMGPDGFSTINFPANGQVSLRSTRPVQLTVFYLRVGKTCSDGSSLKVSISYFFDDMAEGKVKLLLYHI